MKEMNTSLWIIVFMTATVIVMILAFCRLLGELDDQEYEQELTRERLEQAQAYNAELLQANVKLTGQLQAEQKRADDYKEKAEILQVAHERLTAVPVFELEEEMPVQNEAQEEVKEYSVLPSGVATNTFRCEPYQVAIIDEDGNVTGYKSAFHPKSDQYALQKDCTTDSHTGIRIYISGGVTYYCAAMATAYGTEIGLTYKITLQCGTQFNVIVADFKHPIANASPTDYGDDDINYDGNYCINILEFVVDMQRVPAIVKSAGTMSALPEFGGLYGDSGNIVKIEYLGRKWKP